MALYLLAVVLAGAAVVDASKANVTPIQKVTELLKGLQTQVAKEGATEAAEYDKYACFCKEQATEKQHSIEESTTKLSSLAAQIKSGEATKTQLDNQVGVLTTSISARDDEIAADATARKEDHAKYLASAKDVAESIAGSVDAIEAFKASKGGLKGAKLNLIQVHNKLLASAERIFGQPSGTSLLQDSDLAAQSPAKFQFQGNGIVASLETLVANFKKIQAKVDMDEATKQTMFDKKTLGNNNENKFAKKDKAAKNMLSATEEVNINSLKKDKDEETKDMQADDAFLKTLTQDCEKKAEVFDQRSKTRSEELTAMTQAVAELEGGVKKNEGVNRKLVLIQRLTRRQNGDAAVRRVHELLQEAATDQDSSLLRGAAIRVQMSGDHFVKVRNLIKDLVAKLKNDASSEATQKDFCDKAMKKAVDNRDSSQSQKEAANAQISILTAKSQQLTEDIETLTAGIAANMKAINEATTLRAGASAANKQAVKGATEGKQAVNNAISLLRTFYSKAAAASLVQLSSRKYTPPNSDRDGKTIDDLSPSAASTNYRGSQSESKGIIGMLEVISADFDRTVRQVEADERGEVDEFNKLKTKTDKDTKAKAKSEKAKNVELVEATSDKIDQQGDRKDANALLKASLDSLDSLKAQCVEGEETWAERAAARKKEIESLKDATKVLDDMQN